MQVITMPDERYEEYCRSSDFIREHIFPGGHLPSVGAMTGFAAPYGLQVASTRDIGSSYAITLREWRKNWRKNWKAIKELGYPTEFLRKCAPDRPYPQLDELLQDRHLGICLRREVAPCA